VRGYSAAVAQLLITLSAFAYLDSDPLPDETVADQEARMRRDIDAALADSSFPNWHVVWGPGLSGNRANMLYVAGNARSKQLAVAIRGTDWSFWLNWLEDFSNVLPLVPYADVLPGIRAGSTQIAVGTNVGLQLLLQTTASSIDGLEMDVTTFLKTQQHDGDILVTGHSLGGCLASVLASSLAYRFGSASALKVYTFAGPTAGNQDFADYYDRLFQGGRSFRVYNDLDIVPMSWAALPSIAASYNPAPMSSERIKEVVAWAQGIVGQTYVQPGSIADGSAVLLQGQLTVPNAVPLTPDRGSLLFFKEVDEQHATETYMQLLGAPAIPAVLAKLSAVHAALRKGAPASPNTA